MGVGWGGYGGCSSRLPPSPEDCLKGLGLPITGPRHQFVQTGSELVQKSCVVQAKGSTSLPASKSPSWLAGCPLSLGRRETQGLARESGLERPFDIIPGGL